MYDSAPPGSVVIQLTNSYPTKFKNYENLAELDVASFSQAAKDRFLSDPPNWFAKWLEEGDYTEGYVLITRSQRAEIDRKGNLPPGSVDFIIDRLKASRRFEVLYDSDDAILLQKTVQSQ